MGLPPDLAEEWARAVADVQRRPPRCSLRDTRIGASLLGELSGWDPLRLLDLIAEMTPGDRGLSRITKIDVPASAEQAARRAEAVALRRVDRLTSNANASVNRAFRDGAAAVRNKVEAVTQIVGDKPLTAAQKLSLRRAVARSLRDAEKSVLDEFEVLADKAASVGQRVADDPLRAAGMELPSGPDIAANKERGRKLLSEISERRRAQLEHDVLDVAEQIRTGKMSKGRGRERLQALLESSKNDARRIMVTEAGDIATSATSERLAQVEAGQVKQRWVSALLPTTRPAHAALHGQVRDVEAGETWILNGVAITRPQDPALTEGDVINCKCTLAPQIG